MVIYAADLTTCEAGHVPDQMSPGMKSLPTNQSILLK